jgi:enamine deaminase RidA (YjgF/YER057c/UK114 family)
MGTHMKKNELLVALCATVAMLCLRVPAVAQSGDKVERLPMANPDIPIASAVVVPAGYDTIYVSGHIAKVANPNAAKGSTEMYGDTKTQTLSVLQQIQDELAAQQLSMADVVMVHVFLMGDPANGGKMDFAAMNAGYTQFFGSKQQPNKAARSTVQVVALAVPGALVEIEAIAVRKHEAHLMH